MAGSALKTFSCPGCGGTVEIRAEGRSLAVVCGSCFSVLDANSPQHEILSKFSARAKKYLPLIPLGTRATFRDIKWECIGFMVRSDKSGIYSWDEYLLYNPQQGFRWLAVQNGHFLFVTPLKAPPVMHASELSINPFQYKKESFQKYTDESAVVQFVLGEFYWAVDVGERTRTVDFIRPPAMLSFEISSSELVASISEYCDGDEVCKAFGIKDRLRPFGVAPAQANPYSKDSEKVILLCIPFFFAIFVMGSWYGFENAFTFWCLLFGYVFFYFSRMNGMERQRWENSDYAPAAYTKSYASGNEDWFSE